MRSQHQLHPHVNPAVIVHHVGQLQRRLRNGQFQLDDDSGRHARAAVGVNELPLGLSVEVAVIAEVET